MFSYCDVNSIRGKYCDNICGKTQSGDCFKHQIFVQKVFGNKINQSITL